MSAVSRASGWTALVLAVTVGCFVAYVGLAVCVALFHRDEKTRRQATVILKHLLAFLSRARRLPRRRR